MAKHDNDNRSNQMNPNNDAYWESRGHDTRPDDWYDRCYGDDDEDYDAIPQIYSMPK
ncbi:hypothetical protein C8J30_11280 [Rhodobacter viridis]|uniref:Uncharacterized protein n=1 Tax=Rhodobacter viridis TaxID=1054202 RepID=A0A318TUV9_9RHOB|nr:hypothetical protein [Rhodobacter viridis]PYF08661.1 hypothetical protein C8J30_11280 [Rhodobacter viridis]